MPVSQEVPAFTEFTTFTIFTVPYIAALKAPSVTRMCPFT
jgi:hypothetical protein